MQGKGPELQIGQALLYFFSAFDINIVLSNDKKTLLNSSWEYIQKYFSNSGNLLNNLKKLRSSLEKNELPNVHFSQVLSLYQTIYTPELLEDQSPLGTFYKFLDAAVMLAKFIKVDVN
mmetsp:Transcript_19550/g.14258  ORF Transcript_19550/g.14258 Transcript_19550/m.14258 type:complete len:118 (-) Transcript_19550:853-1206(-)